MNHFVPDRVALGAGRLNLTISVDSLFVLEDYEDELMGLERPRRCDWEATRFEKLCDDFLGELRAQWRTESLFCRSIFGEKVGTEDLVFTVRARSDGSAENA